MTVRPVKLDRLAGIKVRQVGKVIGKESAFHAVDAKVEPVAARRRGDGIGSGLFLAPRVRCNRGNELAHGIRKALQLLDDKLQMVALCRFRDADPALQARCIELSFQGKYPQDKGSATRSIAVPEYFTVAARAGKFR